MSSILTFTGHRQTRRQIARTLSSGGIDADFQTDPAGVAGALGRSRPDLLIIDIDNVEQSAALEALSMNAQARTPVPTIILSMGASKAPLLDLIRRHEIANLVAKHGAIRAVHPVLDERELLVTCQKVIQRDIFGLEKYVGAWGVDIRRTTLRSLGDKNAFVPQFEAFLNELDCPTTVIPEILTVAEEFIINAMVHAPRDGQGQPKYEHLGPSPELRLQPNEHVGIAYGCDGQRLMISVTDNFGTLHKDTVYNYIAKGFGPNKTEIESKAGGAGLGLSMAFASIHQLVFNVQDKVRTEVMAGWYLRVNTALEFRQVGKSLNLFWIPADSQPARPARPATVARPVARPAPVPAVAAPKREVPARALPLTGRIDEHTELARALAHEALDLRGVNAITSRGIVQWMKFLHLRAGRPLKLVGVPDAFARVASEVAGVMKGVTVATIMCPFACAACSQEQVIEISVTEALDRAPGPCALCGGGLEFSALLEDYQALLGAHGHPRK